MSSSSEYQETSITIAITFLIYMILQAAIVIMHEYTHAGTSWLLGYSPTPFTVVWGNVLTLRGSRSPDHGQGAGGRRWTACCGRATPTAIRAADLLAALDLALAQLPAPLL